MDNIGTRIQTLRRGKNLTQEQMAAALGVTAAAVSKWETSAACPDIAMLAPLARLLGTSIDDLLDFRPALTRGEAEALVERGRALFEERKPGEAAEACEALLRQYPDDLYLKFCTASLYMQYLAAVGDEDAVKRQLERTAALFEASRRSEDPELAGASHQLLAGLYTMLGELDKALEMAEKLPQPELNARMVRAGILLEKGDLDGAEKLQQIGLYSAGRDALLHLTSLAAIARRREDWDWALELVNTALELDRLLRMEELGSLSGSFHLTRAELLCRGGEPEAAMAALGAYVEETERLGELIRGGEPAPGRLYSRTELHRSGVSHQYLLDSAASLLEQDPELAPLRALPGYAQLLERLKRK